MPCATNQRLLSHFWIASPEIGVCKILKGSGILYTHLCVAKHVRMRVDSVACLSIVDVIWCAADVASEDCEENIFEKCIFIRKELTFAVPNPNPANPVAESLTAACTAALIESALCLLVSVLMNDALMVMESEARSRYSIWLHSVKERKNVNTLPHTQFVIWNQMQYIMRMRKMGWYFCFKK